MRILLQNFETGLYYRPDGEWTRQVEEALSFRDEVAATTYRMRHQLDNTYVVVRPEASSQLEPLTIIEARSDLGASDALFIRGQGEGLSWDKGQRLSQLDGSMWIWSTSQARDQVTFKLLLNDQVWATGADVVVRAGRRVELAPVFR